ncbi:MAG TPA: hypothetical protein VK661_03050 [Planctomycetota bacterium]|nr:hypothetical protein [Planctomycetota bacterium]
MDATFPDGPWRGYYLHPSLDDRRHRMRLELLFQDGRITGWGDDDVGSFEIRGRYDSATLRVDWRKDYLGAHSVDYRGRTRGRFIDGLWELDEGFFGGFRIWPGEGDGGLEEAEERELATEAAAVGSVATATPIHC